MFLQSPVMPSDQILRPFFFPRKSQTFLLLRARQDDAYHQEYLRESEDDKSGGGLGEEEKKDGEYEMRTECESWKFIISKDNDKKEHVKKKKKIYDGKRGAR